MNASKKVRTAKVTTHTIKNGTMNIRGMDLYFNQKGVCEFVPEEIAILIVPMKGFTVEGLSEGAEERAEAHAAEIEAQKAEEQPAFVLGLPDTSQQDAKGFTTGNVIGRAMGADGNAEAPVVNPGERLVDEDDEEAASREGEDGEEDEGGSETDGDDAGEEEGVEDEEEAKTEEEAVRVEKNKPGEVPMTKAARAKKAKAAKKAKRSN